LNNDWDFLCHLHEVGRARAGKWLAANFDHLGKTRPSISKQNIFDLNPALPAAFRLAVRSHRPLPDYGDRIRARRRDLFYEVGNYPRGFILFVGMVLFCWGSLISLFPSICTDSIGAKYATTEAPCATTCMTVAEHKNIAIRLALVELQP
jgi:hypothetical protein